MLTAAAPPPHPPIAWLAAVELDMGPWAGWSKNRMWRGRAGLAGAKRLSGPARANRDRLALALRGALQGQPGAAVRRDERLWVALHVDKPDHRGDATNAADLVLDAVQLATLLDDRWYAVWGVTWAIDPDRPRLTVWIGQDLAPAPAAPPRARHRTRLHHRTRRDTLGIGPPEPDPAPATTAPPPWR